MCTSIIFGGACHCRRWLGATSGPALIGFKLEPLGPRSDAVIATLPTLSVGCTCARTAILPPDSAVTRPR